MPNGKWETKVRLGIAAEADETLFSARISSLEPAFGGRWNAGSTKLSASSVCERIARQLRNL